MASAQGTRQTQNLKAASSSLKLKPKTVFQISVIPPLSHKGCACRISRCRMKVCPCMKNNYRCTSKCTCRGCKNRPAAKGKEAKDPDTGSVMNELPEEAKEPAQKEEQSKEPRENRGPGRIKRPRNKK
nr:uncharacterized protein LOC127293984 [Lolium perenne]